MQAVIPQKGKQAEAGKSRIGGSRYPYDNAPNMGLFLWEQKMSEQMFYCQVMQELHELHEQEKTAAPAQQEAVETEIEVKNYFGE